MNNIDNAFKIDTTSCTPLLPKTLMNLLFPYKISLIMDSSIDETGSSREKLASFKMISICRKVQLFSYLPIGRIAPFFMLKEG